MNARQFGLKLIANVTYGYTSAGFSGRMPMAEIADSIVQVCSKKDTAPCLHLTSASHQSAGHLHEGPDLLLWFELTLHSGVLLTHVLARLVVDTPVLNACLQFGHTCNIYMSITVYTVVFVYVSVLFL